MYTIYWVIYTASMGFFQYSTQNYQFKILPIAFYSESPNTLTRQWFYLYGKI